MNIISIWEREWSPIEAWTWIVVPLSILFLLLNIVPPEVSLSAALVLAGLGLFLERSTLSRFNWIDAAVAGLLAAYLITTLTSEYRPNSIAALTKVAEACLVYTIIRTGPPALLGPLRLALVILGIVMSGYSVALFMGELNKWQQLGFTDLTAFRQNLQLFKTPSYSGNQHQWFLLFLGIGLMVLYRRRRKSLTTLVLSGLCVMTNLLCLILSFSRLAYLTIIVAFVAFIGLYITHCHMIKIRSLGVQIGICVASFLLISLFLYHFHLLRAVVTTAEWSHTVSQSRSAAGRIAITRDATRMMLKHFWLGYGPGNYGHFNTGEVRVNANAYSPQTYNWYLQVGVEQGLVGLLATAGLFIACGTKAFLQLRNRDNSLEAMILISILVSIGIFNCGQAALFADIPLGNLTASWLALIGSTYAHTEWS